MRRMFVLIVLAGYAADRARLLAGLALPANAVGTALAFAPYMVWAAWAGLMAESFPFLRLRGKWFAAAGGRWVSLGTLWTLALAGVGLYALAIETADRHHTVLPVPPVWACASSLVIAFVLWRKEERTAPPSPGFEVRGAPKGGGWRERADF